MKLNVLAAAVERHVNFNSVAAEMAKTEQTNIEKLCINIWFLILKFLIEMHCVQNKYPTRRKQKLLKNVRIRSFKQGR